jgi:hypothetical protein
MMKNAIGAITRRLHGLALTYYVILATELFFMSQEFAK